MRRVVVFLPLLLFGSKSCSMSDSGSRSICEPVVATHGHANCIPDRAGHDPLRKHAALLFVASPHINATRVRPHDQRRAVVEHCAVPEEYFAQPREGRRVPDHDSASVNRCTDRRHVALRPRKLRPGVYHRNRRRLFRRDPRAGTVPVAVRRAPKVLAQTQMVALHLPRVMYVLLKAVQFLVGRLKRLRRGLKMTRLIGHLT
jgi:hypothetical protein